MQPYRRSRHSVSLLYAHLVFVTKYRSRVFNDAMLNDCEDTLRTVCADLGPELVESNGEPDHVHLLVRYPPAVPISELVRRLNGTSARRMRADYTGRCNQARMHGHFWTPSYFAVSAGGAPLSIIKTYIENRPDPSDSPYRASAASPGLKSGACTEQRLSVSLICCLRQTPGAKSA